MLSVQESPGEEDLLALGEVWNRLSQFAGTITSYSLTEITAQLEAFKTEIVAILGKAPTVATGDHAFDHGPDGDLTLLAVHGALAVADGAVHDGPAVPDGAARHGPAVPHGAAQH